MTPQPGVGEVVAITTTDSHPLLLVSTVTDDHVTGVLLTVLATETIQRLQATEPDTATRRELAAAITHADDRMSFTVPHTDCALVERNSSRPAPLGEVRMMARALTQWHEPVETRIGTEPTLIDAVARALPLPMSLCVSCRSRERPPVVRRVVSGRNTNGATTAIPALTTG